MSVIAILQQPSMAANGVIYIGSAYYGSVDAINANTGALLWSYTTGTDFQHASPVVADGLVFSGSDDGTIYAFGPLGRAQQEQERTVQTHFQYASPQPQPDRFVGFYDGILVGSQSPAQSNVLRNIVGDTGGVFRRFTPFTYQRIIS
jgi:hypothetical protein